MAKSFQVTIPCGQMNTNLYAEVMVEVHSQPGSRYTPKSAKRDALVRFAEICPELNPHIEEITIKEVPYGGIGSGGSA